jgi:hypothetical protein
VKDELIAFLRECPILPSEVQDDGGATIYIADEHDILQIELTADEVKQVQAGEVQNANK